MDNFPSPSRSSLEQVGTNRGVRMGSTSRRDGGKLETNCRQCSTKESADESASSDDDSTYVGRVERSIDSFPTNALIPAACITFARIKLKREDQKLHQKTKIRVLGLLFDCSKQQDSPRSVFY